MHTDVEVISYRIPEDEYDENNNIARLASSVVVSHGVDHATGRIVILPDEAFLPFVKEHCEYFRGTYFLKE
jgi:hypothetical protein